MNRDKSAKFIELANKRVNRAIKELKLIGNLGNKQNYEFTEEQSKKIIRALQNELDNVKQRLLTDGEDNQNVFKL